MTIPADLEEKLTNLEQALLNAHPALPSLLKQIHTQLKNDPAIVTILTEEQIAVIVNGLKKQTQVELVTSSLKKAPTKALKYTTVDDL